MLSKNLEFYHIDKMSKKLTASEYFDQNPLFELDKLLAGKMANSYMAPTNHYSIKCKGCGAVFERRGDSSAFKKVSKCPECRLQYDVESREILRDAAKPSSKEATKKKKSKIVEASDSEEDVKPIPKRKFKQTPYEDILSDEEDEESEVPVREKLVNPFDALVKANEKSTAALGVRGSVRKAKKVQPEPETELESEPETPPPTTTTTTVEVPEVSPKQGEMIKLLEKQAKEFPVEEVCMKIVRLKQGDIYVCGDVMVIVE